ncbi:hypothetical protein BGZ59_003344 [Podila verticillata]|nr:hypothetical protein BGZ59_003344 [Podila verticillata]
MLAEAVSKQSKGRLNINGKNMRERFQRHMKVYTTTKAKASGTGFGVTEEDSRNGIYTVAHKLESMCTCYSRMDVLFGLRPNVTPLSQVCIGAGPTEEQDEHQESSTAPPRRRRLIMEEEEDEEEEEEEEEVLGSTSYETTQQYQEDNNTQDNIISHHHTNTFDYEDLDNDFYDDGANPQEDSVREANFDEGDDISEISISSPVLQRQSKRQLTDTESETSNKRSRATDRRKKPPTLEPSSSPETSRRSLMSSYEQNASKRITEKWKLELEAKRLETDKKKLELEEAREKKRQELEEAREAREAKRLKLEEAREAREEKKLELDAKNQESERDAKLAFQRLLFVQAGMEKGMSKDEVEAFINMALPLTR